MRWNCPHCGVSLGVSEDKLGTGWSFSRCYQCGGYALVRRSEVNVVKVDRAPAGENVLLPDASDTPLLSQQVNDRLARYRTSRAADASPSPISPSRAPRKPFEVDARDDDDDADLEMDESHAMNTRSPSAFAIDLPAPLPELDGDAGSDEAALRELGASFPTPPPAVASPKTSVARPAVTPNRAPPPTTNDGQILVRIQRMLRENALPLGIGGAGLLAIGSGGYLVVQGHAIWEKSTRGNVSVAARDSILSDQVRQNAMAPSREVDARETASASTSTAGTPAAGTPVATALRAPAPVAAAPGVPTAPATPPQAGAFVVEVKSAGAEIHAGPGALYLRVATADARARYVVADWSDRWFKVVIADSRTGWIRTDLVQMVQPRTDEKLPDYR